MAQKKSTAKSKSASRKPAPKTASSAKKSGNSSRSSAAKGGQDAIALLKEDHKKVKGLLSQLDKTEDSQPSKRTHLLSQIEKELEVHTTIEEEIFYPAYKQAVTSEDDEELYYEANEEHGLVKLYMPKVKATPPDDVQFAARAKVLKDLVEHHAGEEEKEMFPKARKKMSRTELRNLGDQMKRRKQELMGQR
ncbi:MAG: hemerythrin domain-containing protein [Acidobacteriota bacterium]